MMSRVPLGKVLLRNVIRHTDAHNKIQEETEMWKIRELEKQTETSGTKRRRVSPNVNRWDHNGYKELYPEEFNDSRSRMRSDGFEPEGSKEDTKKGAAAEAALKPDAPSVRALNKKYYECESTMPDRWGHSGYKELYPDEFDTDSDDREERGSKRTTNGEEESRRKEQKEQESHKRKRSKKTHKKKQKKRSHKKLKKRKKEQEDSTESSSESDSTDHAEKKPKKSKRKKKKTRKKTSKTHPSSSGQDSDSSSNEMSSTEDHNAEEHKERWTEKSSRKHHRRSKSKKDLETAARKSRRTNWKVAKDESSESSDED
ncbi:uncharacterized protein NKAPD1 [Rhinoderma darwinii]|uniref:uncharacterized protein NKAPD1 n=1 Tax=Rhinoderma darwinii TaxID=43563 RepID=UPI003F66544A